MRYQKKPVVISAMQFDGTLKSAEEINAWSEDAVSFGTAIDDDSVHVYIVTLEGTMTASPGDYVIRGVRGEFYPCKPDIFEMTYDKADLDFKERMQKEYEELEVRRSKLLTFRSDYEKWSALEENQRMLLEAQYHAMGAYSASLYHRLQLLG